MCYLFTVLSHFHSENNSLMPTLNYPEALQFVFERFEYTDDYLHFTI